MKRMDIHTMIRSALFIALVTATTLLARIPLPAPPGAYIHPGDSLIYVAAYAMGPLSGMLVGAIGSMLADWLAGVHIYLLPTFIIKGVVGLIAGSTLARLPRPGFRAFLWMLLCGAVMMAGYFLFEGFYFGWGLALPSVLMNLIQCAGSAVIGILCLFALERIPAFKNIRGQR